MSEKYKFEFVIASSSEVKEVYCEFFINNTYAFSILKEGAELPYTVSFKNTQLGTEGYLDEVPYEVMLEAIETGKKHLAKED